MDERGVEVDHSTLNRWVLKYVPLLETRFCARKRSIGSSWRLDETYVKVKGVWKGACGASGRPGQRNGRASYHPLQTTKCTNAQSPSKW